MSQPITGYSFIILNLFSLTTALAQTPSKGASPAASSSLTDIVESRRNEQEAERIKQINEINREIRKSHPVVAERKKAPSKNSDPATRIPDAGDKPMGQESGAKNTAEIKPAIPPAKTGGYIKNAKGPESMIPGPRIKVTTDDTPEELVFPGTND